VGVKSQHLEKNVFWWNVKCSSDWIWNSMGFSKIWYRRCAYGTVMLSLCTDILIELHQQLYSYAYIITCQYFTNSGDSVVVAARLWAEQSGVWISAESRNFSLLDNMQNSSVAHPFYYWMRTWILQGVKHLGYAGDHSPPSSTSACHEWHGQVQL